MNRHWASIMLPITLFAALAGAQSISFTDSTVAPQEKKQPKSESKPGGSSLTGCVDEQDGHYVLVDERTLMPIASLEADGFPTEGFAKHLGHKVTVRGTSNSGTDRPVFKVRSVEAISDACGPQNQ
jgi:hypothetical protein